MEIRIRSCADQPNKMYSLMFDSFCSKEKCSFNILSTVDHLNSIFPFIRIECNRMYSLSIKRRRIRPMNIQMSEAYTESTSVIEIDSRFSWRNSPFDHIQGDQSGSRIPAPAKLFLLIKF